MTAKRPSASEQKRSQKRLIVIAGEDTNDRQVVTHLVRGLRPDLNIDITEIRDSVRLKQATGDNLTQRVRTLVRKANAKAARSRAELGGLIIHEDLDGVTGPSYQTTRARVAGALTRLSPCPTALALAAWETEAWLLLFPEAFKQVHTTWQMPKSLVARDTGKVCSPKGELQRRLGSPKFREDDGPKVAATLLPPELRALTGSNTSFTDFAAELDNWT